MCVFFNSCIKWHNVNIRVILSWNQGAQRFQEAAAQCRTPCTLVWALVWGANSYFHICRAVNDLFPYFSIYADMSHIEKEREELCHSTFLSWAFCQSCIIMERKREPIFRGRWYIYWPHFADKKDPVCKDRKGLLILDAEPNSCRSHTCYRRVHPPPADIQTILFNARVESAHSDFSSGPFHSSPIFLETRKLKSLWPGLSMEPSGQEKIPVSIFTAAYLFSKL